MLEGVDRLIDLVGPRTSALSGASEADVARRSWPLRYGIAPRHRWSLCRDGARRQDRATGADDRHPPALLRREDVSRPVSRRRRAHGSDLRVVPRAAHRVAVRSRPTPAWSRRTTSSSSIRWAVPDPSPRYHRFFDPAVGLGSSDPNEAGARYIAAAYESVLGWLRTVPIDEPVAVAFSGGVDSTSVLLMAVHANQRSADSPIAFVRSRSTWAVAAMRRRPNRSCATGSRPAVGASVSVAGRLRPRGGDSPDRGLPPARRRVRGHLDVPAARHPRSVSASDVPARWRRRRREPEVVSARGFRPDAVEHPAQSAAVSGGLGRRCDQAQPGVLRRSVSRLRADVRARRSAGVRRVLAVYDAIGD